MSVGTAPIKDSSFEGAGHHVLERASPQHCPEVIKFIYEKFKELARFFPVRIPAGYGIFSMTAFENQTDFVLNAAVAGHGDRDGICDFGDRLEIPANGLLAPGNGRYVLWDRSDRGDHPRGRVAQAAPCH